MAKLQGDMRVRILLLLVGFSCLVSRASGVRAEQAAKQGASRVRVQRVTELRDAVWSTPVILDERLGSRRPSIAVDPGGNVHVFWDCDEKIYYRRRDGTEWTEAIDVSETEGRVFASYHPSVCSDSAEGGVHLVWGR